ncbi:uncharacterized protein LOC129584420 [Paramacrobiotus metropolitanus]|uniref:uncharacterized protein LOC129584420 n=1 Tax=Paramacrobiotus metropolitanus TaxID=2943436 RepID=UPI00244636B5|nr:uncharacterized protein LOC129584420 [Paramacrobiotus metropolitanus]
MKAPMVFIAVVIVIGMIIEFASARTKDFRGCRCHGEPSFQPCKDCTHNCRQSTRCVNEGGTYLCAVGDGKKKEPSAERAVKECCGKCNRACKGEISCQVFSDLVG